MRMYQQRRFPFPTPCPGQEAIWCDTCNYMSRIVYLRSTRLPTIPAPLAAACRLTLVLIPAHKQQPIAAARRRLYDGVTHPRLSHWDTSWSRLALWRNVYKNELLPHHAHEMAELQKVRHTGGCHCGAVKFEVWAPATLDVLDCKWGCAEWCTHGSTN